MVLRINNWTNPLAFIQASRLEVANICEQFGSLGRYSSDSLDLNLNREVSNEAKNLFCKFRGWESENNSKIQINMHFAIYIFHDKMWFSVPKCIQLSIWAKQFAVPVPCSLWLSLTYFGIVAITCCYSTSSEIVSTTMWLCQCHCAQKFAKW